MSPERVSVLLPVRDAAATLGSCLRSISRQHETHFECVVVDDGSRDASPEIAESFARDDARFRVLRRPAQGLVPALNHGLDACRTPLVARMDADDWMHRERLRRQCDALDADRSLSGVGCHARLFPRSTLAGGMRAYETWLSEIATPEQVEREAFVECPLPHPTWCLRREVLQAHRYRDEGWPEDYDLLLRLLGAGLRLGVVPERLLGWRHGPERLSQRSGVYAAERFTACKAHHLVQGFLAGHPRYRLWGFGGTGRSLARALRAHARTLAEVIELHPGRLGQRIHGAPVVSPDTLGAPDGLPLLVSVAGADARAEIRGSLAARGWREGSDYRCLA